MKNKLMLIVYGLITLFSSILVSAQEIPNDVAIAGAAVGGFMFIFLIMLVVGLLAFIFWILMLIDCIKRDFGSDTDKIVWVLVMVLLGVIGSIVYYFVVRRPHGTA